jgi:hypothetical protein
MELKDTLGRKTTTPPARVRVELGQRVYVGQIILSDVDFRARVSDLVNDPARRFLPLSDVEMLDPRTGEILGRAPLVLVRVDAIDILVPLEEPPEHPPQT